MVTPADLEAQNFVNMETGEHWSIVKDKRGKSHIFVGGYCFMALVYITRLIDLKLPADGYRLALLLMRESGYAGIVAKSYKDLAAMMAIRPSRFSSLVAVLERNGVAQRLGARKGANILMCPYFCWRGKASEQHKAIELWNANRPFNLVKPDEQRKSA